MFTPGGHISETTEKRISHWESPDCWRLLVQDFPGLFVVVDFDARILVSNLPSHELPQQASVGQNLLKAVRAEYQTALEEAVHGAHQSGDIRQVEVQLAGLKSTRWYSATVGPVRENGLVAAVAVAFTDVTEYKQAEAEQRASENRYRLLAESSTDIVVRCSGDGTLHYVSPACVAISEFSQAELIGRNVLDLVHPEDSQTVSDLLADMPSVGDIRRSEFRLQSASGRHVWVEMTARLVRPETSQTPELICAIRDISKRHATLEALRSDIAP